MITLLQLLSASLTSNNDGTDTPKNLSGDSVTSPGFMLVGQLATDQDQKEQDDDTAKEKKDHLPDDAQVRH